MNCNCLSEAEELLKEHFKSAAGDDVKAKIKGRAIGINPETLALTSEFNLPVVINGSKKGFIRGKETTIRCSYCPFCGKSIRPEQEIEK